MISDKKGFNMPRRFWPLFIFFVALLVRIIYLWEIKDNPFFSYPLLDANYHYRWAAQIAHGHLSPPGTTGPFFRAPLYPLFLGFLYLISWGDFFLIRLWQIILGSLNCVMIYVLAAKVVNRGTGIIAGLIAAFYAPLIYFDAELMIPVLANFLNLAALIVLTDAARKPAKGKWFGAGVLVGLAALARPNMLLFIPAAIIWMVIITEPLRRREIGRQAFWFLIAAVLTILPVTGWNIIAGRDLVLISSQGGVNFYIGNNPAADGHSVNIPGMETNSFSDFLKQTTERAEAASGTKLKPSQVSKWWFRQGLRFIAEEPLAAAKLAGVKVFLIVEGVERPNNKSLYLMRDYSRLFSLLLWRKGLAFPYGLLISLAGAGIVLSFKRRREFSLLYIFILTYAVSLIVFFVNTRYRLPLVPVFIVMAADFIYSLYGMYKHRSGKGLGAAGAALVGIMLISHLPLAGPFKELNYKSYFDLASRYMLAGDCDNTIRYLNRALELEDAPRHYLAFHYMGFCYAKLGKVKEAEEAYQRAIGLRPDYVEPYLFLADFYLQQGYAAKAVAVCRRAASRVTLINDRFTLAGLYLRAGDIEAAAAQAQAIHNVIGDHPQYLNLRRHIDKAREGCLGKP